jgi:hypothetical protein
MSGSDLATSHEHTLTLRRYTQQLKNDRWAVASLSKIAHVLGFGLRCLSRLDQIWISVSAIETIEPNR